MKIGLLPLYIRLYDQMAPQLRIRMEAFYGNIAAAFEEKGVQVVRSSFCRVKPEFEAAVALFEQAQADAIVTVHMAYSPSLESIDALAGTALPLVVLDTTETLEFTPEQDPGEVMYCHGIHGVMDLCCMLRRRSKAYAIAAGHFGTSDCVERALGYARAAVAAANLRRAKVGLIGGHFAGMGDFLVSNEELRQRFGIQVTEADPDRLRQLEAEVTPEEIAAELAENEKLCTFGSNVQEAEYRQTVRSCLATRKYLREEQLTAFSANFTTMGSEAGLKAMPFLEACKAMARGVGYAGEGDLLTAAFVGALLQSWPETSFVEIFCPDWKNNTLFLSHMGETNYRVAATRPHLMRAETNYSPGAWPYMAYTRMKGGRGVYLNISPGPEDFGLFLAPATMCDCETDHFAGWNRGFLKLDTDTAHFLEQHSIHGATHHSVFVYGATVEQLAYFGRLLGMRVVAVTE